MLVCDCGLVYGKLIVQTYVIAEVIPAYTEGRLCSWYS